MESKELEEGGGPFSSLLPSSPPGFVILSVVRVRDRRKGLERVNARRPAREPRCELESDAVCYRIQQPQCQRICNTFQDWVRRPGADDGFYLFIYLFILLTGKSEICRVLKQLENRKVLQRAGKNEEGRKINSGCDVPCGHPLRISLSCGRERNQGVRHRAFVMELLTGTPRGHLGTEQQINVALRVHCSA